jgi:serine/threonine-protein kinase
MAEPDDSSSIGRIAVDLGFVTPEQLADCLRVQAQRKAEEKFDRVGDLLMEMGLLDQHRLDIVLDHQRKLSEGKNRIGNYEIMREIGRGAMGVVFKARQISLDRDVALKVIDKGLGLDKGFRERFLREAQLAAKLSHPNIVKAIDAGETQKHYYFAMEFFETPDLLRILKREGEALPEKTVVNLAIQVGRALDHAHENRLVHRDIKPENILFDEENGLAKVTDFGLAKSTEGEKGNLTQAGSTLGTPHYISPESISARETVDGRSDIYSLGATMYHLVTGRVPYDADSVYLILKKHSEGRLTPPRSVRPKISHEFNRIIIKAMEKRREKRYQTPAALLTDLERLDRLGPEKAFSTARTTPKKRRPPKSLTPGKRNLGLLVGGIAASVLVVLGLVLVLTGGKDEQEKKPKTPAPDRGQGKSGQGKSGQGETGKTTPSKPTPSDTGKEDEKAFKEVLRYAAQYPDNHDEIIHRFLELARKTTDKTLAGRCTEEAGHWEARRVEARRGKLETELRLAQSLRAKGEFGPAINVLSALATRTPAGDDLKRVKEMEKAFWEQARAKVRGLTRQAEALARKRRFLLAAGKIRQVLDLKLPNLWKEVEILEKRYNLLEAEGRAVAFHRTVIEACFRHGFEAAVSLAEKANDPAEKMNLAAAAKVHARMTEILLRLVGSDVTLLLLSGEEVRGKMLHVLAGKAAIRDSRDLTRHLPLVELDPGPWRKSFDRYGEVCFLWYACGSAARLGAYELLRDMDTSDMPDGDLLRKKMEAVIGLELGEQVAGLEDGTPAGVFRRGLGLIRTYRSTTFYDAVAGRLETLFAEAARRSGQDPEILLAFAGTVQPKGTELAVTYGFALKSEQEDLAFDGAGTWSLRGGALRQTETGILARADFRSVWSALKITANLKRPSWTGEAGLVLVDGKGVEVCLVLFSENGAPRIRMVLRVPSKEEKTVGRPLALPRDALDKPLHLFLGTKDGKAFGECSVAGRTVRTPRAVLPPGDGAWHAGLEADGPVEFLDVACEGTLHPAWVTEVRSASRLKRSVALGKWTDLLGAGLRGFSTKGKVTRKGAEVHLSGDRADLTLQRARHIFGTGRDILFSFRARRDTDMGWAGIRFSVGSRDIIWILMPESDETRPYGVPEEHAVISAGTFEDGKWHDVTLDVTSDTAKVLIDGILRESFDLEMLVELQGGVRTEGFGLTVFGGSWVFDRLRVRKTR